MDTATSLYLAAGTYLTLTLGAHALHAWYQARKAKAAAAAA